MTARPKKSFISTSTGGLPSNTSLVPNTRYSVPLRPGAPVFPFDDKGKLVAWMTHAMLGDLRTLNRGIQIYISDPQAPSNAGFAGANYLLASGCFLALEYFAQVFHGSADATANVKQFVLKYLKPQDGRYADVGDLVWKAFRNGLVHGGWPKAVSIEGKPSETIELMVGVLPRDPHLEPLAGRPDTFCLNAVTLFTHLEIAVTGEFSRWVLATDEDVLARGAPRRLEISSGDKDGMDQFSLIWQWNGHNGPG